MKTTTLNLAIAAVTLIPLTCTHSAQGFDHEHQLLTEVLQSRVSDGRVDYAGLKRSPAKLNAYLESLAEVPKAEYDEWTRDQRMAFLINLYNAATLDLIVDHYPVESIKDIGGFFGSPWGQEVVSLWGDKTTLDHVEHGLLRPEFEEARIHFAVNCASIGCPDLRREAYQADKLDAQLEQQTRAFLRDRSRNRYEAAEDTLYLSPIFKWYSEDFVEASGSVADFVGPYMKAAGRQAVERGDPSIRYTSYDWDLNEQ